jgi:DNA-binding response OmpR family regulator
LIVDDHQESLAMCALGLLAMGFQPVTTSNGEEAFARACDIRPDAIVTAAVLPDTSGLELTRRFRDDVRTRAAGIIILIGAGSGSVLRTAADAGCDRVLRKPCLPDALGLEIRDVLRLRHHASARKAVCGRVNGVA